MAAGFKKSLFGFNCSDVIDYIEKSHKSFIEKEKKLNSKADKLLEELETAKAVEEKLISEKHELEEKLNEFEAKYEEIERLSENIGKLYLVAQTNAKAIMANSEESAKLTQNQVEQNLYTVDEAHKSLAELRNNIAKTSESFINEVEAMISSLAETKEQIAINYDEMEKAKKEFTDAYQLIVG